jgi:hypothetical protein
LPTRLLNMGREKSLNLLTTKADILIIVCKIQLSTKFGYFSFKALVQEYQGVMEPASFTLKKCIDVFSTFVSIGRGCMLYINVQKSVHT